MSAQASSSAILSFTMLFLLQSSLVDILGMNSASGKGDSIEKLINLLHMLNKDSASNTT